MKQYYEFVGMIPGNLAENEIQPIIDEVVGLFKAAEADIKRNELLERRKMAYVIDHMRHAYYFLIGCDIEGEKLSDLERKLKLHKNLMRFLITKLDPKTEEQIKKEQERLQKQKQQAEKAEKKEQETPRRPKRERERPSVQDAPVDKKSDVAEELEKKEKEKLEQPVDIKALDKKLDEILDEEIN